MLSRESYFVYKMKVKTTRLIDYYRFIGRRINYWVPRRFVVNLHELLVNPWNCVITPVTETRIKIVRFFSEQSLILFQICFSIRDSTYFVNFVSESSFHLTSFPSLCTWILSWAFSYILPVMCRVFKNKKTNQMFSDMKTKIFLWIWLRIMHHLCGYQTQYPRKFQIEIV